MISLQTPIVLIQTVNQGVLMFAVGMILFAEGLDVKTGEIITETDLGEEVITNIDDNFTTFVATAGAPVWIFAMSFMLFGFVGILLSMIIIFRGGD